MKNCLKMEIELSVDVVKPFNFVRKRQAVLESFSDHEEAKVSLNLFGNNTC